MAIFSEFSTILAHSVVLILNSSGVNENHVVKTRLLILGTNGVIRELRPQPWKNDEQLDSPTPSRRDGSTREMEVRS